MIQKHKWMVVPAGLFAAGGVVFVLNKANLGPSKSNHSTVVVNTIGADELDSIDLFIEPATSEECSEIAKQVADRALATPGLSQSARNHSLRNEQQLRRLIEERVRIMLNPEYEAYVRQIGGLFGIDGREALRGTMFEDEQLWRGFASAYKDAGIAVDATRATLDFDSVTIGKSLWGGRQTTFGDPGIYGSKPIVDDGGEVVSVSIPIMIPPSEATGQKIMVVYITLSFVFSESNGKWIPYRTAVYDPTGALGALPVLWI